jgi:hypothetical protein
VWRLQLALDAGVLDDELGIVEAGLHDGVVVAAAASETTCRAYFSQEGVRSMIELELGRGTAIGSLAGRFGPDPARVVFKECGLVLPPATVVDSLALQPRTPIAVEVERTPIKVIFERPEGDVQRLANVVFPTVGGVLAVIGGSFADPKRTVLVQDGVVLAGYTEPIPDVSTPIHVRALDDVWTPGSYVFVQDKRPFGLTVNAPTIGAARATIAEKLRVPPSPVVIRDRNGLCSDRAGLDATREYQVVVDDVCFGIELRCGSVFRSEKVIHNFAGRKQSDIVRELLAFARMPGVRTVDFSMENRLLVINLPPPSGVRRYTFYANGRAIGCVNAAPGWQVADLKTRLLTSLYGGGRLPGCLSLRFWDTELLNGTTIGQYRIPHEAALVVAEVQMREFTIAPGNTVVKVGPTDTVSDLKLFLARQEKLRLRDITITANGDIADATLLWSLRTPRATVLYQPVSLPFECGEERVTVTLPANATLSDLRSGMSSSTKKPPELFTFTADGVQLGLATRVSSCLKNLTITVSSPT